MGKIKISKDQIKEMYLSGKSSTEIAKIAKCLPVNISCHLKRMGVIMRTSSEAGRKYTLNQSYFKEIDSEEKAYILGFLFADGYNQESKNQLRLTLEQTDKHTLDRIALLIFGHNKKPLMKITRGERIYYDLSINSKEICADLARHGCMQNKTFKLKFPENINDDLRIHFIRGYFDGDGCVSITKRNDRTPTSKTYQFNISGREDFLLKIQEILISKIEVNKTPIKRHVNIYYLQYAGLTNVNKVLGLLYNNATIYLDRKYEKYISIHEAVMSR